MADNRLTVVLCQLRRLIQPREAADRPDRHLLEQFAAHHDERAFAALVQRHGPVVLGLCRRILGNVHDAEDAFQATFLVLARKASSIRDHAAVGSWLCGVGYKIAARLRADLTRRRYHEQHAGELATVPTPPTHPGPELRPLLDELMQALPQKYRIALVLCYLENKSCEEAARQMQRPIGTVKSRLARAREMLRQRLVRRGFVLTPAALGDAAPAAVSAALADKTVAAGLRFVGAPAAGAASGAAAALAEGALRVMTTTRWRVAAILAITACAVGLGTGWFLRAGPAGNAPEHALSAGPDAAAPLPPTDERGHRAQKDAFGEPLPPGAQARLGQLPRFWHDGTATLAALAPDGKTVAAAGKGGILLWDVTTGIELRRWQCPNHLLHLAFSPNGQRIATADYDSIRLWDVNTGTQQREITGAGYALAFSPDGKTLAAGQRAEVTLWDLPSGKRTGKFTTSGGSGALAFSPDGKLLAVGGGANPNTVGGAGQVSVHEVETGKSLRELRVEGRNSEVHALAFAPDGKTVAWAAGEGNPQGFVRSFKADFLTVAEGSALPRPPGRLGMLKGFSPGGKVLLLAEDDTAFSLWDWTTGKVVGRLDEVHWSTVSVSADGNIVATRPGAWRSKTLQLWDATTGKQRHPPRQAAVHSVTFSPDSRIVISGSDHENVARFWNAATGQELRSLKMTGRLLAVSPDGKTVVVARQPEASLCDAATGQELVRIPVTLPGGRIPGDGWDASPHRAAFSSDGKTLALAQRGYTPDPDDARTSFPDTALLLWDIPRSRELWTNIKRSHDVSSLQFAADGKTLAAGIGGEAILWDVATGKERRRWKPDEKQRPILTSPFVVPAPDGRTVALATDSGIRFWELATGRERLNIALHGSPLAYSPDGKTVAALVFGEVRGVICLLEAATGQVRRRLHGHQGIVRALAFSPDGKVLASGSDDTTTLVWAVLGP